MKKLLWLLDQIALLLKNISKAAWIDRLDTYLLWRGLEDDLSRYPE
jgi:hypothetical protein